MKEYTETKDWIEQISGGQEARARIGLTTNAIMDIGPIVWIDLPQVGHKIQKGDVAVIVESTKAAVDIAGPVSGTVFRRNESLLSESGIHCLNEDPEGDGWLYEIIPDSSQK